MFTVLKKIWSTNTWQQRLIFWMGAVFIGIFISLMTKLSEWAGDTFVIFFRQYPELVFLIAPLGMGLTRWLTYFFFPNCEGSGVPQVKIALEINDDLDKRYQFLSLKMILGKMLLPIMGLFSGASVGFGGPAIQVGASVMTLLGKTVKSPAHYMEKGLILAGSAAGFAAMFSAPLAGIIFAIEEMGRSLEARISSLVLTTIILAGITAYALLDSHTYFNSRDLLMPWGKAWLAVPLCGIVGGVMGGVFSRVILTAAILVKRNKESVVLVAMVCGFYIATLAYITDGETLGTGYQQTKQILEGDTSMQPMYPFLRMLTVVVTAISGIPSGIFVPSISVGAGLGLDLAQWFPIAPMSAMILLTITAYFSGMLQSPITAFVMVMEISDSHGIMFALMASALIASATSHLINPVPLYRALCNNIQNVNSSR